MLNGKPLASLSSSLLARKGQAKPAMRPQGFSNFGMGTGAQEDLGWNDMGFDAPQPVIEPPAVVLQREELASKLEAPLDAPKPAKVRRPRQQALRTGKAAFTLRLDAQRHLRLRLAVAVKHRSAQDLVTEALDLMLKNMPELDEMAARARDRASEENHA
jgi:hypothetical protein